MDKMYIICNFYRPLGGCLELGKNNTAKVFIMGDYNIDLLEVGKNKIYYDYHTMMNSSGYTPTILFGYTPTSTSSFSIIDRIRTNYNREVLSSGIIRTYYTQTI